MLDGTNLLFQEDWKTKRDLDAKKKCLPDTRKKDKIFVYRVERSLMDSICKQNI